MLRRAALLLAIPAVLACKGKEGPHQRPPQAVTSGDVTVRDVPVEIRSPVDLRPLEQADVGSKTLGYLDAVLVDRGDKVKRGQILALVRPSDLPDQLSQARGQLAQLDAQLVLARANYERGLALAPTGFVSQQDLQQEKTTVDSAEAALAAAQSNVGVMATRLGETRIISPLDGFVFVRNLDPGALVGPGTTSGAILTVQRMDVLRVFVPVNERDVAQLRVGEDAHLELDALPGRMIQGKVVRASPSLDPSTRTVEAEVHIQNSDGMLRPGMYGRAAIVTDIHRGAVVIAANAVQITSGKYYAFVVGPAEPPPAGMAPTAAPGSQAKANAAGGRDGKKDGGGGWSKGGDASKSGAGAPPVPAKFAHVHRVEIQIGVDTGDWVEVTKGLSPGDEIVTAGIDVLSDGVMVRALKGIDPFTGRPVVTARTE